MGTSNYLIIFMKILTIGTNGFLGSWVNKLLQKDLSNFETLEISGKKDCDVTEFSQINSYLKDKSPDIVINCAAFVGGISYGYKYPVEMLSKKSLMAMNIYKASSENCIKKLNNQKSNCAYPAKFTTYKEENIFNGPPDKSVFNYALSKDFSYN